MSELTNMIADSAQRLFDDQVTKARLESFESGQWQGELWAMCEGNGFPLVAVPEEAGGTGGGWSEAYPILRGVGYWQVPLPLVETIVASALLARAGIEIPEGPLTLIENGRQGSLVVRSVGAAAATVDGRAQAVPWARACGWAVLSDGDTLALVNLKDSSVTVEPHQNVAAEPRDSVSFAGTRAAALARHGLGAEPVWVFGAMARAAALVGATERVLDQSVQYANERVQFGRPIGKNQAIQQELAVLAGEAASARMAVRIACDTAAQAGGVASTSRFDVAVAKVRAGEAAGTAAGIAHQTHGAIGFTYEHTLHFATRRLWSWRAEFGTDAQWAAELGRAAIAAGSGGFWAHITQRSLLGR